MTFWRRAAAATLLLATGVVIGAAASLSLTSGTLGAATTTVPQCTTAGLTVFQNLSGSTVVSVTVGAIPAACAGATLQVTVNNGVTNASGSATVPGGGGSVTVALGTAPAVTTSEQTDLVMVGP
ncbi:MAG: hypothetical protein OEW24_00610 [Chloroflexota bacterium]|nr:hypothetical protein [Chloroflexota bacterium]